MIATMRTTSATSPFRVLRAIEGEAVAVWSKDRS
jgi:hypothetical protein